MICWTTERKLTAYVEDAVSDSERQQVRSHLRNCSKCSAKVESQRAMRSSLRALPRLAPPSELSIQLRVLASRERAIDRTPGSFWRRCIGRTELFFINLMKPLALPAAGGLCSAVLFFTMLVPTLWNFRKSMVEDVPLRDLIGATAPTVTSMAPIGFEYGNAEVDLRIDGQGRIINYSIVDGSGRAPDTLRRSIENTLLFTTFKPATSDGVPIPSTLRLSFQSSRIDVKG
jgi:hypothetical protein